MPEPATRILVVDDDFATRLLACEALLADGFEPIEAADGREAIEQYDRKSPAAILLDVNMPGLDGYEVCRRVRLRPGGESTAVMVMTANDDLDAVSRAFAAGATDFLTKPLNLPLLAHRVRYMLRAAETATAARETASRLARAQRLARIVHWELGADDRLVWASDPLAVFWPEAPPATERSDAPMEGLIDLVHPDDRERVAAVLAARAAHTLDFRLQFPDGSERIVHQDAELDFGDRGVVLIGATQDVTAMKRAERQIAQLAFYDDLTGIPNRPFVERYLRNIASGTGSARATPRSAIAIDLGSAHLDRLSAATRDVLIRAATARVIDRVRGEDLELRLDQVPRPIESFTGDVLVARTAPDELILITTELTSMTAARTAVQLAEVLAQPFAIGGAQLVLRPRVGVADYPDPVAELHRLGAQARSAMHEAERIAPRNVVVLSAAAREQRARRVALGDELAVVLDLAQLAPHPELAVDYVPRVEPATRRVFGVRARPRWLPAAKEPVLLDAILGEPALRDRLASWTLKQACRDGAQWLAAGTALRVAVELPYTQLVRPGFAGELGRLFGDTRFEPVLLDLELIDLPERTDDDELDRIAGVLHTLRGLGVRVALACVDDRRSLGELRRLPLDSLRVERSAIERLGPSLLATVAAVARGLALRIAVTEIDTPAALAVLDAYELDELTGALLGAAVPAAGVLGLTAEPANDWLRRPTRDSLGTVVVTD
jgi:CheY-like chemotaxis protein/predicted signal transduction protein with EAL and GGDEF domain